MSTPQGPQGPPPGYYYPPQPPQPKNGLGTAALVLGIIAAVFAFIPLFGIFFAIPLGVLALIFGGIGVFRAFRGTASNKGVAISGTTLGVVAFILTGVMTAAVFGTGSGGGSEPVAAGGAQQSGNGNSGGEKAKKAGVGDTIKSGDIAFTVTDVHTEQTVGESFMETEAKGEFKVVDVTMKNTGDDPATMMSMSHSAYDKKDRQYQVATDAMTSAESIFLEDVSPGQSVDGSLYFDVTEGTKLTRIEFAGGMLAEPAVVSLK